MNRLQVEENIMGRLMYFEKAKNKEQEWYRVGGKPFVPCTAEEVEELEHWLGNRLPES